MNPGDGLDRVRDRIEKMERLAADPGATPGERDNAKRMAEATRQKYGIEKRATYVSELASLFPADNIYRRPRSPAFDTPQEMPSLQRWREMVTLVALNADKLEDWEKV